MIWSRSTIMKDKPDSFALYILILSFSYLQPHRVKWSILSRTSMRVTCPYISYAEPSASLPPLCSQ